MSEPGADGTGAAGAIIAAGHTTLGDLQRAEARGQAVPVKHRHAQSLHEPVTTRDGKIATTVGQSASFPSQGPDLAAASQHPDLAASGQAADLTGSGQAPNLTARLLATEKENDSLQTWVLVMLGLGLGAGTALGVLVAAVFINVRGSREVPS